MGENRVLQSRTSETSARIDDIGMLLWKIAVLVIGLRMTIITPASPTFLTNLRQVALLLQGLALILGSSGLVSRFWRAVLRQILLGTDRALVARPSWRGRPSRGWAIPLAIDCALAATIIPLSISLAVQDNVDWLGVARLLGIAAIRTVYHELSRTAPARMP